MKLKSRKASMYLSVGLICTLMPIVPTVVDASTTNESKSNPVKIETVERTASYVEAAREVVAVNENFETAKEESIYANKAVFVMDSFIEVYSSIDEDAAVVGKLYENNIADVIEQNDEWTKISSGNLEGFVESKKLCFGREAQIIAEMASAMKAEVVSSEADIYSSTNANAIVITTLPEGSSVTPVAMKGDFYVIETQDGTRGYIGKEEVSIDFGFSNGITIEEEEAIKAAEEAERIAQEEAQKAAAQPAVSASDSELWLLACIIDWEAGWESYEGKLAVANVVMNRVNNPRFADSITGVIYSPGQFSGVLDSSGNISARFGERLTNGPRTDECMQAALEALSGVNVVPDYHFFRSVAIAEFDRYSSYRVIGNHVFY